MPSLGTNNQMHKNAGTALRLNKTKKTTETSVTKEISKIRSSSSI